MIGLGSDKNVTTKHCSTCVHIHSVLCLQHTGTHAESNPDKCEHAAPGKNLAPSPSSQRYLGPPLQFCISSEMDLIWSIPNVDEICRRIRAGGSATSMALGREYGISCGSSTATVRRTGWTRQLDGAALCAVSSSLQHLASHVSAWPQRSNLKQGPM